MSIFSFICLTISQLSTHGVKYFNKNFETEEFSIFYPDYYEPKFRSINLIKGVSIILVSYSC